MSIPTNTVFSEKISKNLSHYDLFRILEILEYQNTHAVSFGDGNRNTEPAKISSVYALDTAPADIHSIVKNKHSTTIQTNIYGLGTTDGPFDANLIERIMHNYNSASLKDFLDIFHHRIVSLFYKSHKLLKSNTSPAFKALISSLSSKSEKTSQNPQDRYNDHVTAAHKAEKAAMKSAVSEMSVNASDNSTNPASVLYTNKNNVIDKQITSYASTLNIDTSQLNFAWPAFYTYKSVQKYLRCVLQNNKIIVKTFTGSWTNAKHLQYTLGKDSLDKNTPKILGNKTMQASMGLHCTIPCDSFEQYLALLPGKHVSIEILRKIQHHLFLPMSIMLELKYESENNGSFGYLGQTTTIGKKVLMHSSCIYNTDHEIFY